jgi:hypothetical protein
MLILTRRLGEAIVLGDNVRIVVVGADEASGTVRFETFAPESVPVSAGLGISSATAIPKAPVIVHKRKKIWSVV